MVQVSAQDIQILNELTETSDKNRGRLTSTLLTVYAALSSGLFLFVSTRNDLVQKLSTTKKTALLITAISALLIVGFAALEKMLNYFASVQVGKSHAKNIREGKANNFSVLKPSNFVSKGLSAIPWILTGLIIVNAVGAGIYIISEVI